MLVLNKIDLTLPLVVLNIRTDEGTEAILVNELDSSDVTEDMVAVTFDETDGTLKTEEALVIAEVITKSSDDGRYSLGTAVYEGQSLFNLLPELEFIFVHHLGCFLPIDVKSVDLTYVPVTPSPISFAQQLNFHKIENEETKELLAIGFSTSKLDDNQMGGDSDISISFNNHMFYQYFGMVKLENGQNRFCSYDVPMLENHVNALLTLQNDKDHLKEISGVELCWLAEDYKLTKVGDKFTIYSTVMLVYPYTVDTKLLSYVDGSIECEEDNPFDLDEDSVDILMENVGVKTFAEIKLLLAQKESENS